MMNMISPAGFAEVGQRVDARDWQSIGADLDSFGCAVYNYRMAHLNEAPGGSDRRLPKSI